MATSEVTPRQVTKRPPVRRAERVAQAMALRRAGADYRTIGAQLGCSHVEAWRLVGAGLKLVIDRTKVDAEKLIALEVDRLDALLLSAWARAQRGEVASIMTALKVCESRRRLLGLDASVPIPQAQDVDTTFAGYTVAELHERWRRLHELTFGAGVVEHVKVFPALPESSTLPEPATTTTEPSADDIAAMQRDARLRAYAAALREREAGAR